MPLFYAGFVVHVGKVLPAIIVRSSAGSTASAAPFDGRQSGRPCCRPSCPSATVAERQSRLGSFSKTPHTCRRCRGSPMLKPAIDRPSRKPRAAIVAKNVALDYLEKAGGSGTPKRASCSIKGWSGRGDLNSGPLAPQSSYQFWLTGLLNLEESHSYKIVYSGLFGAS